ncbi:MAG: right-handed parallel beta-helix repeat-containing protein [Planctomycetota bacterium]
MGGTTNLKKSLVISVFLVAMVGGIAAGETIYVDADASPGGDGASWGTAYKYLQDALAVAGDGNDIWVADGTYYPDEDEGANVDPNDRTETFQLINGVPLYGGFAGGESSLDERDWQTNETILSGDINTPDVNTDNSYHVVTGSGTDANAVIDAFTIKAGNANGSDPCDRGGGMYNDGGSPTILHCTFSGNSAGFGGGMFNDDYSSPTVTNCTFSGNSANNSGGGMYNLAYSSPTLTNCTFSGNSANQGGGMYNWTSSPTLTNCSFISNSANDNGGAMLNHNGSSPTVANCTFSGNSAGSKGGGMYNDFSSNPTVTNCIFWGDSAPTGPEISNSGSSPTVSYSDIAGGYGGTGNIDEDPLFVDADGADNIVGTEDDNLRLLAGSPCIDAGDNTAVPSGVTTDLDGNPRFVDHPVITDTGNGTPPIVDMGAYEYGRSIFVDADATGSNNGSSWEDAYKYLQDALAVAGGDDQIWVAEGTYKPTTSSSQTATFQLINGVGIYGGYAGFGEPDPNERNVELHETILSGDLNSDDEPNFVNNSDNSYNLVTGSGTDVTAVLDGFTITAGNANGTWPDPTSVGGGMYISAGSPTVMNCTFSGNWASNGGGMHNFSSSPTVTNCMFIGNSAAGTTGGMHNHTNSSPTVTNCTFIGNSSASGGSGMFNFSNSNSTITNCTFTGNTATSGEGGGMCNGGYNTLTGSSPTVTNCTFSRNSAVIRGGGMYNYYNSNPTLTNCIIWGNTAPTGPQIYNHSSSPTVTYSDIAGGYSGTGNIPDDPLFIDADGPDNISGTEDDNLHLLGWSPCINAGDPSGDYTGQVDLDGKPRVAYGRVDMGADEVFPAAGDFEPDGDVDFVDFAIFAGNWLLGVE